jgi:DNA-binding response OmpR family regulator
VQPDQSAIGSTTASTLTVLVADDDRDIRELVSVKLRQSGYHVVSVSDGTAALAAVREHRPALAVLDVMMPGLSGLDVVRHVRDEGSAADMAIILLTAKSQEFDIETGFALGADDYIVKPFSPREFVHRVNAVLARTRG